MLTASGNQWPGVTGNTLTINDFSKAAGVQSAMPGVYSRPSDAYTRAAWTSALATGALAPMDHQRFARLANLYDVIEFLAANREKEDKGASTLSALTVPQELGPEARTRMFQALYEVDATRFMFNYTLPSFVEAMRELGWSDKEQIDRFIKEDERESVQFAKAWRPCVRRMANPFTEPRPRD
jgi:hypothetical protein